MTVLTGHHRDSEFGSHSSLPSATNPYQGGSLERGTTQRSQPTRSGYQSNTLPQYQSSKQGTTGANTNKKPAKPDVAESFSSSSDSDD
jgi:hypothetical protein